MEIAADFYDFVVTDIGYVIDRAPDPGWRVTAFANPRLHILAVAVTGKAGYEIGGVPYAIRPGDVIFMPKGLPHTGRSDAADPWRFISVGFDVRSDTGDVTAQLGTLPHVTRDASPHGAAAAFAELHTAWNDRSPGYLVQIRGIVSGIMHGLIRAHSLPHLRHPHTRRIMAVTEMIRENHHRTFSVAELAAVAGLSPSHFRAMFKRLTGQTVVEYQQGVRIGKATELLLSGECNVSEAALRAGFRDVYYFSRLFKKVTGTNPSELTRG
ncbi:hypothetical protein GCM10023259_004590 [Thermocatellispora tengchongensis]